VRAGARIRKRSGGRFRSHPTRSNSRRGYTAGGTYDIFGIGVILRIGMILGIGSHAATTLEKPVHHKYMRKSHTKRRANLGK